MIKAITGTKDILPVDIPKWKFVEKIVESTFQHYNYKEIRTPIFEETALFSRGIGETTDIVGKEMYTFIDRGETSLTLKPEMTASVVRALIEHSLNSQQSLSKLFYISPMFRQERPQAGRLRQFHQFGAEALGSTSYLLDVEIILIAYDILSSIGLKDLTVKINSLGIPSVRDKYKEVLKEYLNDKYEKLSEESRNRFNKNILRIFDSKIESDQEIMKDAPVLLDYLDEESKDEFLKVQEMLSKTNIPYQIDAALVRGLDYYTKTTFEIISGKVGSQSALCGGGRYDLLVEQLGGKPTPGVGFAAGIERILLAAENEKALNLPDEKIDVYIVKLDKELSSFTYSLATDLRRKGLAVEIDYLERSIKAQMREANKFNANIVVLIGGDEFKENSTSIKNMKTGEQEIVKFDLLFEKIKNISGV